MTSFYAVSALSFTIVSFFQILIQGREVGIRAEELENFSKINERGGGGRLFGNRGQHSPK